MNTYQIKTETNLMYKFLAILGVICCFVLPANAEKLTITKNSTSNIIQVVFQDSSAPIRSLVYNSARATLTGTVSTTGTSLAGSGTQFTTELKLGDVVYNVAESESRVITAVASNTAATLNAGFSSNITAGSTMKAKGMQCTYQRSRSGNVTAIHLVTGTVGTFTSGGLVETNVFGVYQLGVPDAAFGSGDDSVTVLCQYGSAGMLPTYSEFRLTDFDFNSAKVTVTALDANTITSSVIQDGALSASKFPADGVAQTCGGCTSTEIKLSASEPAVDNVVNGNLITIVSGTGPKQTRLITAYNGTTKVATVDAAWTTSPSNDSAYVYSSFRPVTSLTPADIWAYSGTRGITALANNTITAASIQDGAFTGTKFPSDGTISAKNTTTLSLSGGISRTGQFDQGWRIVVYNDANPSVASSCILTSTNGSPDTVVTQDDISTDVTTPTDKFTFQTDGTCGNQAQLTALPGTTPTLMEMVKFLYQYGRNKIATTNSATTLYKNDGTTQLGNATLNDNGTTFTRDRMY